MPKTTFNQVVDALEGPAVYGRALVKPALLTSAPKESQLDRIERKLDALLKALAQDEEQEPTEQVSLDGSYAGRERDPLASL